METSKNTYKRKRTGKKSIYKNKKTNTNYKIYIDQENPKTGKQYTDNLFPPDEKSLLGIDVEGNDNPEFNEQKKIIITSQIEWKRSNKILFEPHLFEGEISTKNISPGIITSSYFLSAIDALCKYPYLISKIFITKEYNKDNCFFR